MEAWKSFELDPIVSTSVRGSERGLFMVCWRVLGGSRGK